MLKISFVKEIRAKSPEKAGITHINVGSIKINFICNWYIKHKNMHIYGLLCNVLYIFVHCAMFKSSLSP